MRIQYSVEVATVEPIELNGLQTVDGVALHSGDLVLVKDQREPLENGIYRVAAGSWDRLAMCAKGENCGE